MMSLRLCLRCRKPVEPPYWFHFACATADAAERRARILSAPEKVASEKEVRGFFGELKDEDRR